MQGPGAVGQLTRPLVYVKSGGDVAPRALECRTSLFSVAIWPGLCSLPTISPLPQIAALPPQARIVADLGGSLAESA
jgi:hypothetical protein